MPMLRKCVQNADVSPQSTCCRGSPAQGHSCFRTHSALNPHSNFQSFPGFLLCPLSQCVQVLVYSPGPVLTSSCGNAESPSPAMAQLHPTFRAHTAGTDTLPKLTGSIRHLCLYPSSFSLDIVFSQFIPSK